MKKISALSLMSIHGESLKKVTQPVWGHAMHARTPLTASRSPAVSPHSHSMSIGHSFRTLADRFGWGCKQHQRLHHTHVQRTRSPLLSEFASRLQRRQETRLTLLPASGPRKVVSATERQPNTNLRLNANKKYKGICHASTGTAELQRLHALLSLRLAQAAKRIPHAPLGFYLQPRLSPQRGSRRRDHSEAAFQRTACRDNH